MPSKPILGFWAFFDVCLLAAGVISVVFALIWQQGEHPLRHIVITGMDLTAGLVLGIFLLITFIFSIGAIVQPHHVTLPLALLNWALIVDTLAVVVVGTMVWWATLQERKIFGDAFSAASSEVRQGIQDQLSCCGYYFNNETQIITLQGFCQTATNATACVGPITAYADATLNDIFTSVYGFVAVIIGLFLSTLCVIKKRQEVERFRRIDAKRGGRGFV